MPGPRKHRKKEFYLMKNLNFSLKTDNGQRHRHPNIRRALDKLTKAENDRNFTFSNKDQIIPQTPKKRKGLRGT